MKFAIIILGILSIFEGCKSTKKGIELCYSDGFAQTINNATLSNVEEIKKSNGKFLQIEGIFNYNFEDVSLNPSKHSSPTEAIWLNFTDSVIVHDKDLNELNGRKVMIIGKVNLLGRGHYNGYIAAFDSVFCIKEIK